MVDVQATLDTLRSIKNAIIGNPVAKSKLASDGTVALVLEWINASEGTSEPIFELIRIEAAHIIAAQAYGPPEALLAVLAAQAPQALVIALRSNVDDSPRLLVALTRALRSVVAAAADTVGPFRWHLPRLVAHPARLEARLVLEDVFASDTLNVILPLLKHPELEVRRNIALLLARGVRIDAHRTRVTEWNERAAVWSLVVMLDGEARSQAPALYALAELSRDNDTVARLLWLPIPPSLISFSTTPFSQSELGLVESPSAVIDRGRTREPVAAPEPLSLLALTGRGGPAGGLGSGPGVRSMSRSISGSGRAGEVGNGPRVLDLVKELLPARDGDVRESACLCLSTVIRQLPPLAQDPTHALVMWLNVTLEDFAPGPDSAVSNESAEGGADAGATHEEKCRWKTSEVGGGDAAKRVVRACHILADFVTDRPELQQVAVKSGTLHRAVRALLALPPVPVSANGWMPVGRWGSNSSGGATRSAITAGASAAPRTGTLTIGGVNGPSGIARTRRASSALLNIAATATSGLPTTTAASASPTRATVPPPLLAWNTTPASSGPLQRRLSFAELARRASESGPAAEIFVPRGRRTSGASLTGPGGSGRSVTIAAPEMAGSTVTTSGTSGDDVNRITTGMEAVTAPVTVAAPADAMTLDPASQTPGPPQDVLMGSAEAAPVAQSTSTNDVVMSSGDAADTSHARPPAPVPISEPLPSVAQTGNPVTRRRRKPPPDPALGPYNRPSIAPPTSASPTAPDNEIPPPPSPTSPIRAALLVLLAALVMHKEEHRRLMVDLGALGSAPSQTGPGAAGARPRANGTAAADRVAGVLGALGCADAEVRWSGAMVVRAVGRSTSVLRTGLYDSGIGRAIFELLMRGDPDRRVLAAVLMVCCNMLNHYSPMREMFIRDGGMARLAELADDNENAIRLNALWAIKNSLFKSTTSESRIVLDIVGWARLNRLLDESTDEILEQVLGIIRNVTVIESDAEWIVPHITPQRLLSAIERSLSSESTSLAAMFALTHLSLVSSIRMQILGRRRVLDFICSSLGYRETEVRCAAAYCVERLAGGMPRRLRELREASIDARLRIMRNTEEDVETREHVRRALNAFES